MTTHKITTKVTTTMSFEFPVPCTKEEFGRILEQLNRAYGDGYVIKNAAEIDSGDQRDPYVVGVRLMLEQERPA